MTRPRTLKVGSRIRVHSQDLNSDGLIGVVTLADETPFVQVRFSPERFGEFYRRELRLLPRRTKGKR